jgi:hypothetical protein
MNVIQEFTECCRAQNFSLSEVARMMDVNKGTLQQIVNGKRKCPPVVFGKMVKITISQTGNNKRS